MAALNSSESNNYAYENPNDLRFTHYDISSHFSGEHEDVKLEDDIRKIRDGCLDPAVYPPMEVYRDENGVKWCNDNRRLYVLRKAGVQSVKVKFVTGTKGKWKSGNHGDEGKRVFNNPDFYPLIRGESREIPVSKYGEEEVPNSNKSNGGVYYKEESESSVPGLLAAAAALVAGFATWRFYKRTESEK